MFLGVTMLESVSRNLDPNLLAIDFRFIPRTVRLRTSLSSIPTKSWTSLIRQEENGQLKTFAEEDRTKK